MIHKTCYFLSCLLFCALFSGVFSGVSVAASKVTLLVEEHPPYIAQQASNHGIMTGLVVDAFKRVKVSSEVSFKSWAEVEDGVDEDKGFSFMWRKNKPRMKKWFYSDVIYQEKKQLLANRDFTRNVSRLHNLRGIPIGVVKGFKYGEVIEGFRHKLSLTEHVSNYANLKSLLAKQQQLIIIDPMVAVYLSSQFFSPAQKQQLKFIETAHFTDIPYYLVCSKRYGNCLNYIKKFNKGLNMLRQDGTLTALFNQGERL